MTASDKYRVTLACIGVSAAVGPQAATDIEQEFAHHRTWHHKVSVTYDSGRLEISAENDFDDNGLALMDEFSDCLKAFLMDESGEDIEIISVIQL